MIGSPGTGKPYCQGPRDDGKGPMACCDEYWFEVHIRTLSTTQNCDDLTHGSGVAYARFCVCEQTGTPGDGSSSANAGFTCNTIHLNYPSLGDGLYYIDPDGADGDVPFEAYCDMTTDEGGWTLVARIKTPELHEDSAKVGTLTSPTQSATGKLADVTINLISTNLYRFTCGPATSYFDASARPFAADGNSEIIRRFVPEYEDINVIPWCLGNSCDPYKGFCSANNTCGYIGMAYGHSTRSDCLGGNGIYYFDGVVYAR